MKTKQSDKSYTPHLIALLALLATLVVGFRYFQINNQSTYPTNVNSFETCRQLKTSQIQESNPPSCVTSDGKQYIQILPTQSPTPGLDMERSQQTSWPRFYSNAAHLSFSYPPNWQIDKDEFIREGEKSDTKLEDRTFLTFFDQSKNQQQINFQPTLLIEFRHQPQSSSNPILCESSISEASCITQLVTDSTQYTIETIAQNQFLWIEDANMVQAYLLDKQGFVVVFVSPLNIEDEPSSKEAKLILKQILATVEFE